MKESRLIQLVRESWKRIGSPDDVLVGFSGGADSTALLSMLKPVVPDLRAVHVDHGVRSSSGDDAAHSASICESLGVPLEIVRLEPEQKHYEVGLEESLRRQRYLAFAQVAKSVGAEVVALAHHAQDQAESVLLHLLRGAGLSGSLGMREISTMQVPWWDVDDQVQVRIWRPFLDLGRDELVSYLGKVGLTWVDDESNLDVRFRRNAIRHELLPELERVVPGSVRNLARFGSLVADEDAFLDELACASVGDGSELVLRDAHPVIQRRMVRMWLQDHAPGVDLTRERIDAVVNAAGAQRGEKRIELGSAYVVIANRGVLRVVRVTSEE